MESRRSRYEQPRRPKRGDKISQEAGSAVQVFVACVFQRCCSFALSLAAAALAAIHAVPSSQSVPLLRLSSLAWAAGCLASCPPSGVCGVCHAREVREVRGMEDLEGARGGRVSLLLPPVRAMANSALSSRARMRGRGLVLSLPRNHRHVPEKKNPSWLPSRRTNIGRNPSSIPVSSVVGRQSSARPLAILFIASERATRSLPSLSRHAPRLLHPSRPLPPTGTICRRARPTLPRPTPLPPPSVLPERGSVGWSRVPACSGEAPSVLAGEVEGSTAVISPAAHRRGRNGRPWFPLDLASSPRLPPPPPPPHPPKLPVGGGREARAPRACSGVWHLPAPREADQRRRRSTPRQRASRKQEGGDGDRPFPSRRPKRVVQKGWPCWG